MTCSIYETLNAGAGHDTCEQCGQVVSPGTLNLTSVLFAGPPKWVCRKCLDNLVIAAWRQERERGLP
jgi:hypothetical protein